MKVRSISLRLALTYTVAFAIAVVLLGVVILVATRTALKTQFDARIEAESAALAREYVTEGLIGVIQAVRERDRTPGALDYGLEDEAGRPVAGRLAHVKPASGWSVQALIVRRGREEHLRMLATDLPNGYRLIVGDDLEHVRALDSIVLRGFALAVLGVIVLGGAGGYVLSRDVRRRFAAISDVAEATTEGDLSQRVAVRGARDDLDDLSLTFNRMLDRIGALLDSLRQVSNDVAHDLRTPLTRLRHRLEGALATTDLAARGRAIEEAMGDLDAILETFAALLRIAQIEGGARRAGFGRVDLTAVARNVVESFAPSAEDGGRSLILASSREARIVGDAELLTQMVVNLVENSLRHTSVGAHVHVRVASAPGQIELIVADDGPGVPHGERDRIFDRFYRLERSRSTPGSGLGLSLVAAVAKLHGAEVALADIEPGLETRVSFPIRIAGGG